MNHTEQAWQIISALPEPHPKLVTDNAESLLAKHGVTVGEDSHSSRLIVQRSLEVLTEDLPNIDPALVDWWDLADRFCRQHFIDYVSSESTVGGEMQAAVDDEQRDANWLANPDEPDNSSNEAGA